MQKCRALLNSGSDAIYSHVPVDEGRTERARERPARRNQMQTPARSVQSVPGTRRIRFDFGRPRTQSPQVPCD
eukprot:3237980-Rhodomonas_salina.2